MKLDKFYDRVQAGRLLAKQLRPYADRPEVLVLGLPRGGVPVAYEVAQALHAPLDICLVRKLGVPGQPELAMGAIAPGNIRILNADVVNWLHVSERIIDHVVAQEQQELARRERAYRGDRPLPNLQGRIVILVDDGLATGATMRAAVAALRQQGPQRIVVAVPVASTAAIAQLQPEADEVICVMTPEPFHAIGLWYEHFPQTSDAEVQFLLSQSTSQDNATVGSGMPG
jgi:putative phosphoribosyl transferase